MKIALLRLVSAALAATSFAVCAQASTVLVKDDFNGLPGSLLDGTKPDSGYYAGNPWTVTQNPSGTKFGEHGSIFTSNASNSSEARIGIGAPTGILTLSFDVVTNTADWVGGGFLSSTSGGTIMTSGLVWVMMNSSGSVTVFRNGTASTQSRGWSSYGEAVLGAYDSTATYTLTLSYDPSRGSAHVLVSKGDLSVPLVTATSDGWFPVAGVDASLIAAAGFRINGKAGTGAYTASVGDFLLTTEGVIPEPAHITLALGGVLALLVCLRRRNRSSRA